MFVKIAVLVLASLSFANAVHFQFEVLMERVGNQFFPISMSQKHVAEKQKENEEVLGKLTQVDLPMHQVCLKQANEVRDLMTSHNQRVSLLGSLARDPTSDQEMDRQRIGKIRDEHIAETSRQVIERVENLLTIGVDWVGKAMDNVIEMIFHGIHGEQAVELANKLKSNFAGNMKEFWIPAMGEIAVETASDDESRQMASDKVKMVGTRVYQCLDEVFEEINNVMSDLFHQGPNSGVVIRDHIRPLERKAAGCISSNLQIIKEVVRLNLVSDEKTKDEANALLTYLHPKMRV